MFYEHDPGHVLLIQNRFIDPFFIFFYITLLLKIILQACCFVYIQASLFVLNGNVLRYNKQTVWHDSVPEVIYHRYEEYWITASFHYYRQRDDDVDDDDDRSPSDLTVSCHCPEESVVYSVVYSLVYSVVYSLWSSL